MTEVSIKLSGVPKYDPNKFKSKTSENGTAKKSPKKTK